MMSRFASFFGRAAEDEDEEANASTPAPTPATVPHRSPRPSSRQPASSPPKQSSSASASSSTNRPRSGSSSSSGSGGNSRHKGGKRKASTVKAQAAAMGVALGVSPRSAAALNKLQRYNQELEDLENEVADMEAALQDYPRTPRTRLLEAKDQIAQMNGSLEKLQYSGVDSIITAELESGKERAKEKRKSLNQRCDALRERILQDSKDLQKMLAAGGGR